MIDAIGLAREKHDFDLWAYVIMPEHVHLLIFPNKPDYRIDKILSTLKQPVAKRARYYVLKHAPSFVEQMSDRQPNGRRIIRFWQRGGGYDRNLTSPRYVWEKIDYIHRNPVRRQLCSGTTDWPWSSATAYEDPESAPLQIDFENLPHDPRRRFR